MAGDIICVCCHHKIDKSSMPVCDRCGWLNMAIVGDIKSSTSEVENHRKEIIANLKDISVVGYQYGWNKDTNVYEQLSEKSYKIADGLDCDGKVVWSDLDFGQWWDESEKAIPIKITFQCGKRWSITQKFLPLDSPSFWHVGVKITEDMHLVVLFGNEGNCAQSPGIDFIPLLKQ